MPPIAYPVSMAGLAHLLEIARDLSEPGELNEEYVRGQVNLICDASGVPFAMDVIGTEIQAYIERQPSSYLPAILAIVESTRAEHTARTGTAETGYTRYDFTFQHRTRP